MRSGVAKWSRVAAALLRTGCDDIDDVQQGLQGRAIAAADESDLALIFLSFNEARALGAHNSSWACTVELGGHRASASGLVGSRGILYMRLEGTLCEADVSGLSPLLACAVI